MGSALSVIGVGLTVLVHLVKLFREGSVVPNPTIQAVEGEARRAAGEDLRGTRRIPETIEWEPMGAEQSTWAARAAAAEGEARRMAEGELHRALLAQEAAEYGTRDAEQSARTARAAAEEAERIAEEAELRVIEAEAAHNETDRKWKEGIQPEVWPTAQELNAAKRQHQYKEGLLHFAIAGVAGSGKSSLINAVRGVRNNSPGAAATGVKETTAVIGRYPDPNPEYPFVWYDVPGAGTLNVPDWKYFNAQGLYIFDCIIVLFDNRFTSTDVAILKNCARFKIPTYIVRSKANQHIRNIMEDIGYTSDEEDDDKAELYAMARDQFITETRQTVRRNLELAQMPQQRVYIVAKDILLGIVKGREQKNAIDEMEFLQDVLSDASSRRVVMPRKKGNTRAGIRGSISSITGRSSLRSYNY